MKITRNTRDYLVIDSAPWLLAAILLIFAAFPIYGGTRVIVVDGMPGFGIGILVFGALFMLPFFWGFVRRYQLILDRPGGKVILRRRTIFGYSEDVYDLTDLDRAEVETRHRDRNDVHRILLRFGDETRPFLEGHASGSGARQVAQTINAWLEKGEHA